MLATINQSRFVAPILMSAGAASLVINDALVKTVANDIPKSEIIAIRAVVIAVVCGAMLNANGRQLGFVTNRDVLIRTAFTVINTFLFVAAVTSLPFSIAVLVDYSSLLFIGIMAPLILNEPMSAARMTAAVLGLYGCYLVLSPEFGHYGFLVILPLLSAVSGAGRDIWTRRFVSNGPSAIQLTFHAALGLILVSLLIPDKSAWVVPGVQTFLICIAAGGFQAIALLLTAKAFMAGEATLVAPFRLTAIIWTLLISLFWFNESLISEQLIGLVVIIVALLVTTATTSKSI